MNGLSEELRTARLVLTPLAVSDAMAMVDVLADPALYRYTGGTPPTVDELERRYESQVAGSGRDDELWHNWIIRLGDDGLPIGLVQATVTGAEADVAWIVGTTWQGLGYAKEAVAAMCGWLVGIGAELLAAHIHPNHLASQAVAVSVGLTRTGQSDEDGEEIWSRPVTTGRSVILVEGESDRAALVAAAGELGVDLSSTSIVVMNGATNVVKMVADVVGRGLRVAGLYDVGEEAHIVRALSEGGLTEGRDPAALERRGFYACDRDLEEELIRALGAERVVEVIKSQGEDLRRFRSLQQMPEWRERRIEDQLRRWFGSGGSRKVRYPELLVGEMVPAEVPRPLRAVLEYAAGG